MESICQNDINSIRLAPPFSTQETVAALQAALASSDTSTSSSSRQAAAVAPVIQTTRKALLHKSTSSSTTSNSTTETTSIQSYKRQPIKLVDRFLHQLRSSTASLQLVLFIFALLLVSHLTGCATATPLPSISSSGSSSKEIAEAGSNSISAGDKATAAESSEQLLDNSKQAAKQAMGGLKTTSQTAEKLKRGLTNFMNQLNAAPFFVPTIQPGQPHAIQQQGPLQATLQNGLQGQEKTAQSSSAEPATIVTGDSSLVGLKGPANRWAFARPIGGPLRWGRR